MSEVYPETPPGAAPPPGEPPLTTADMLVHEAAAREQHQHGAVHDRAACGLCPATPGQRARAAWNDHWAGPDPYPAGETQEETFERVWGNVAQAVLNDAFPGLKRELAEARAVVRDMIAAYKHLGSDRWASEITGSQLPEWHDRAGLDATSG